MVAMADPLDYFAIEDLRMSTGFRIEPAISTRDELQRAIARHYGMRDSMSQMMVELPTQEEIEETEITDEDSPIVRLVNQMIQQAVALRASDIHVDPGENNLSIRYRIDGTLRTERVIPKQMQGFITARLKIMAKLNIAERRLPRTDASRCNLITRWLISVCRPCRLCMERRSCSGCWISALASNP